MIQNQEPQQEEEAEVERPAEVMRDKHVPPQPQEIQDEGRKIYVTKSSEKYHLSQGCETPRGYRSYERKACEICRERSQRILTISTYASPNQRETELIFAQENEFYHYKECTRMRSIRRKETRPICLVCESEEGLSCMQGTGPQHKEGPETIERLESKIKEQKSEVAMDDSTKA